MRILIAPLNWGLGHAARCVPLVRQYLAEGDDVVLGGDGESLLLLRKTFPSLQWVELAPLQLHYDRSTRQRAFYWRAIPQIARFAWDDRRRLQALLTTEHFDLVISDNRFGLRNNGVHCVYMTHQLYVRLPRRLRLLQPIAQWMHRLVYQQFDEVWVPDYPSAQESLSGALSHGGPMDDKVKYINPLSRFEAPTETADTHYDVVAVLSGLEPQRTLFEEELMRRFAHSQQTLLLVRGKIGAPPTPIYIGNITLVPFLDDKRLAEALAGAKTIIARSGYSTMMDMERLGVMNKMEWHPTPDQPEQEYLANYLKQRK